MQKTALALAFTLTYFFGYSQKEFFHSQQKFTEKELSSFYSSITIDSNRIYFMANDYTLYAYDKQTLQQNWKAYLSYKTNITPFVNDEVVYVAHYKEKSTNAAMFNAQTGVLIRDLPTEMIETKPLFRDGILYGTAIYEGGCLFAYDIRKDTILWWKFLAHGVSNQPYFFKDYIYANAEGDNWVKINYQGNLVDTTCKEKADIFVSDIPCIRNFNALTHDGQEINGKLAEKIMGDDNNHDYLEVVTSKHNSFVLYESTLSIIGNKKKLKDQINIPGLDDSLDNGWDNSGRILRADDERVVFYYSDHILFFNHKNNDLEKIVDLTPWKPHRVVLENEKAWLISKNDGRLYGLQL